MATDDSGEPRGLMLVAMLLIGAVGLAGVFVPFVPSGATLAGAAPLALVLAYGTAWANAIAAERRRGRPDPREKRMGILVFGTILLLFAYYAFAMTLPFAWTTATGTPGTAEAELETADLSGSRHATCDYRLENGVTGFPGVVSVCIDRRTFERLQGRRVRVALRGPRTALGLRVDGHDVVEDLGPLR